MPTKKIAFLFLTIRDPNHAAIWDKYLKYNKRKYSLYIHAKDVDLCKWNVDNILAKEQIQDTEWGFITRAYLELIAEAFKDPNNYKFVTISESCVPIQLFADFYDAATADPKSWIHKMYMSRYDTGHRLANKTNRPHFLTKHAARFCLNREHAEILLNKYQQKSADLEYFHNMHVGDEFFLSVLGQSAFNSARNFEVTRDDWDYVEIQKRAIKDQIRKLYERKEAKHAAGGGDKRINYDKEIQVLQRKFENIAKNPKTIDTVDAEDLLKIKRSPAFFYRKFSVTSNIAKYWTEIVNYHNTHKNTTKNTTKK